MVNRFNVPGKICPKFQPITVPVQMIDENGVLRIATEMRPVLCFQGKCEWFCEEHQVCWIKCKHLHIEEFYDSFECIDDNEPEG